MKLSKKGVALGQVLEGILALIVLGIIITVVFGDILLKPLAGISDFVQKIRVPEKEFTPYEMSDKVVIDSLNGLRCGLNSAAAGALGIRNADLCPEYDEVFERQNMKSEAGLIGEMLAQGKDPGEPLEEIDLTEIETEEELETKLTSYIIAGRAVEIPEEKETHCGGVKFGDICVDCFDVRDIALSSDKETAIQELVTATLNCWRRFEANDFENIHCSQITIPPDLAEEITERPFCKALEKSGDLGADLAGEGICGGTLIFENYEWQLGTLKKDSTPFYICGDNSGDNELFLTRDLSKCPLKDISKTRQFTCVVKDFELPQKIEEAGYLNPLRWVAGYSDPDYVVYYQAFPPVAAKFWHVDKISVATVGILAAGFVVDILTAGTGGKAAKEAAQEAMEKGFKETAEVFTKKGVKETSTQFFVIAHKKGWARTLKRTALKEGYSEYFGVGKKISTEVADMADELLFQTFKSPKGVRTALTSGARKGIQETLEESILPTLKQVRLSDDFFGEFLEKWGYFTAHGRELLQDPTIYKQVREEALEEYRKKLAKEFAEQALETHGKKLTKEVAQELLGAIPVKTLFREMFKEGFEEFNEKAIQKAMSKALKKLTAVPWWRRKLLVDASTDFTKKFIAKDGLLDFVKLTGKEAFEDTTKRQLTNQFLEAITSRAAREEADTLSKIVLRTGWTAAKGLKHGTLGPGSNPLIWLRNLFPVKFAKGKLTDLIPVSGWVKYAVRSGAATVAQLGRWIRYHKYPIIAAIAIYAEARDAADDRYNSVGMNSLAVARPGIINRPVDFALNNVSSNFFIAPKLHKNSRFYLASPCKADLIITKDLCTCFRMPIGYQHIGIDPDHPPLDVKGVKLNAETLQDEDFVYDYVKRTRGLPEYGKGKDFESEKDFIEHVKNFAKNRRQDWEKYPETYIDIEAINDTKSAIAAREKIYVAQFYSNGINGIYLGGEGGVLWAEEEKDKAGAMATLFERYKPYLNLNEAQTECFNRGFITRFIDYEISGWKDLLGLSDEDWKKDLEHNPYVHPPYNIPCITVAFLRHEGWNDDINYCIDEFPHVETARWTLMGVEITLSLVLTGIVSTVTAGAGWAGLPYVIAVAGIGFGTLEEYIARQAKWPAHHTQGALGQVPITQTEVTEEMWNASGWKI